ncbi:MAG: 4'-phosphopantetheinyl transferase superfamily protein, partial [Candidatus Methanosuratincola sp.]
LYLACDPASLRFSYGTHGKPHLECDLRFNLSHSEGLAAVAVAWGREVGVDIERVREGFSFDELAGRFFSPYEAALISSLAHESKMEEFFRLWTRKEAYMKALGVGMSLPLARLDFSHESGGARLLSCMGEGSTPWRIEDFTPAPGYTGAVAVEGEGFRVKILQREGVLI